VARSIDHPTSRKLVETGVRLAHQHGIHGFTVEMLLGESGISKGSLYHFFEDFTALQEAVQVRLYTDLVDESIAAMEPLFFDSIGIDDFRSGLGRIVEAQHDPLRSGARMTRVQMVGATNQRPRFGALLGAEQQRLRDRLADLIEVAQTRGWVTGRFHADVVATFVLAYSFGRVLDDIATEPVKPDDWNDLVGFLLSHLLTTPA